MQPNKNGQNMKTLMTLLSVFVAICFVPPFVLIFFRFFSARGFKLPVLAWIPGPLMLGILPLIFIGVWLAVVAWVYRDAESRNMNGVLWAILCFVGNVIGLIVYLIMRNEEMNQGGSVPATPCPSCQNIVKEGFAFCPYCGHQMKSSCSACGKTTSPEWKVCPHCGKGLTAE